MDMEELSDEPNPSIDLQATSVQGPPQVVQVHIDKSTVVALLADSSRVRRVDLPKPRSAALKTVSALQSYQRLLLDNHATDFVVCKICQSVVQFVVSKGTTGILKHHEACSKKHPRDGSSSSTSSGSVQTTLNMCMKRKLPKNVSTSIYDMKIYLNNMKFIM